MLLSTRDLRAKKNRRAKKNLRARSAGEKKLGGRVAGKHTFAGAAPLMRAGWQVWVKQMETIDIIIVKACLTIKMKDVSKNCYDKQTKLT